MARKNTKNAKAKAKDKQTVLVTNTEALKDFAADTLATIATEDIAPKVCETIGMEYVNNTVMNNVIGIAVGTAIATKAPTLENAAVAASGVRLGQATARQGYENLLQSVGLGDGDLDKMIENLMTNKEYAEADAQLAAQDSKDLRASAAKPDTVTPAAPEPESAKSIFFDGKKDKLPKKSRHYGAFDAVNEAEAVRLSLKAGVGDTIPKIEVGAPLRCSGEGCDIDMTQHGELRAAVCPVTGKAYICCKDCLAKNEKLVADIAADQATSSVPALSLDEIKKLTAEYKEIIQNEQMASERKTKVENEAILVLGAMGDAETKAANLKAKNDDGTLDDIVKEAETNVALLQKDAKELEGELTEAEKLLAGENKNRRAFSIQHAAHMSTIVEHVREASVTSGDDLTDGREGSGDMGAQLKDVKGKDEVSDDVPFPNADPKSPCPCRSTKLFKNCCGRFEYVNPDTGKVRKYKDGDVRKHLFKA